MRILPAVLLIACTSAHAQLLDPAARDEDISGTRISVDVTTTPEGLYAYKYSIAAPASNKGSVAWMQIDLNCATVADRTGLPDQPSAAGLGPSRSEDAKHSPVNLTAEFGTSSGYSITAKNWVLWGSHIPPGQSVSGLRITSTMPPKARTYELSPSWDTGYPWNYEGVEEDTGIPWIPDFTVYGTTRGPACAGDPPPPPPPAPPQPTATFPGTVTPSESEAVNALLSYSTPLMDRMHAPAGTQQLAVTIHYGKDIDPKTFEVEPQSEKLRKLFSPKKDFAETVFVPLEPGKNKVIFSVQKEFASPGQTKTSEDAQGRSGSQKDMDVFEVRVEGGSPGKPAKSKG